MKRNTRCFCIWVVLCLLLSGCNTTSPKETTPTGPTVSTPETAEPSNSPPDPIISCQQLPKVVSNPKNLPVLKWVCLTERPYGGGVRTWNETAGVELNQMLEARNMPFRVQFILLTMDQWLLNSDWFSRPEAKAALADADLIYGMMTSADMQTHLLPITQYAKGTAEPSLKSAVPHKYNWLNGMVDHQIYGIPTTVPQAYAGGWIIKPETLIVYGLSEGAFGEDFCKMDGVFSQIYSKNGHRPFLYLPDTSIYQSGNSEIGQAVSSFPGVLADLITQRYKGIGACFAIDCFAQIPTVVNALETDRIREVQQAIARYTAAGYVTEDRELAQLQYCTVFSDTKYYNHSGSLVIPNTRTVFHHTDPGGMLCGLSRYTRHKEEALSLLKLIAEDTEFRMQLFYGKEGRDHIIQDGYYVITVYDDGSSYSLDFLSPLSYFSGLTANSETANFLSPGTENWSLLTCDGKDTLEAYRAVLDSSILPHPVVFDYAAFGNELKAMEIVYKKYFPAFSTLTQAQYDQMLLELEAAGSKKILTALQQQLAH